MSGLDATLEKIRQLPEPLVQEVSDFVDFLLLKRDRELWTDFAESDFPDYRQKLEDYEDRLARGEIRW